MAKNVLTEQEARQIEQEAPALQQLEVGHRIRDLEAGGFIVIPMASPTSQVDRVAPWDGAIVEVSVLPLVSHPGGTVKVQVNSVDVTDVMTCAVAGTVARCATIAVASCTFSKDGTISVVGANGAECVVTLLCARM